MFNDNNLYANWSAQLEDIVSRSSFRLSNIKPSEWVEKHRVMPPGSAFEGRFSYDRTPYTREIVDHLSPDSPMKIIAIMKGAQIGFSAGVIEAGIPWIISQNPTHVLLLTGHADLSEESIQKIDEAIDSCGIRHLIFSQSKRAKGQKTGDTNNAKEFPGGSLKSGSSTNHNMLRQRSVGIAFIDDIDAAKMGKDETGNTVSLIQQRLAAFYHKMKIFYISTPQIKSSSIIWAEYILGDQRKWCWECPHCGQRIPIEFKVPIEGTSEMGGITYRLNPLGQVDPKSVEYVCQKCGVGFKEKHKWELNLNGLWVPTATSSSPDRCSYHIPSFVAPPGMFDWTYYANEWEKANPQGQPPHEDKIKTFMNVVEGYPFEPQSEAPKADQLQANCRSYDPFVIPEQLSIADGNGKIVLLTCGADMNGTVDDARLDWEITAWSETGATYSVAHGSVGTFIPRENTLKVKVDRAKWTYEDTAENNVWKDFDAIIGGEYLTDSGRKMKVSLTGIDSGHYTKYAYRYCDTTNHPIVALKGDEKDTYIPFGKDARWFSEGKERKQLYIVWVGMVKEEIARCMQLRWTDKHQSQPPGYMNYPRQGNKQGLYTWNDYFSHYEAEHRTVKNKADGTLDGYRWVKKSQTAQNHMFDCRVYNIVIRDIFVYLVGMAVKNKYFKWTDYVAIALQAIN